MYAKLDFGSGTLSGIKVRDIVRLITDSNSGSASLSNLEGINVGTSELITGVNSGWSLGAGQTIPTAGTAVSSSDSQYSLVGTCVNSSKNKYVSIHHNASFTSLFNNNRPGIICGPIVDYGTATEDILMGYSSTNATLSGYQGVGSGAASVDAGVIYVFATPRKLILIGYNAGTNVSQLNGSIEYAENGITAAKGFSPVVHLYCGREGDDDYFAQRQTSGIYAQTNSGVGYIMPNAHLSGLGGDVRWFATLNEFINTSSVVNYQVNTSNGTSSGSIALGASVPSARATEGGASLAGSGISANTYPSPDRYKEINPTSGALDTVYSPLGNFFPYLGLGYVDFSPSSIYRASGAIAVGGDNISIGSDDYYFYDIGAKGTDAFLIKKE